MASRYLLPRLLRSATRSVSSQFHPKLAHSSVPQTSVFRPSLLPKSPVVSLFVGSKSFSSCSVFPRSASPILKCVELQVASRTSDIAQPCVSLSIQQTRTMATKLKKTKMKAYSSYKKRFRGMANGDFKRWRSGKRHNAHSKTNKQKRQLRRPSIAPHALAVVMKKLNFLGGPTKIAEMGCVQSGDYNYLVVSCLSCSPC